VGGSHAVSHGRSHVQDCAVDGAVGLYAAGNEVLTSDIPMVELSLRRQAGSVSVGFSDFDGDVDSRDGAIFASHR
jgi:hypothetical protein